MEKRAKENLMITIIGIGVFAALMNFSSVLAVAKNIVQVVSPLIVGGILALFLSVPVNGLQKRIIKWTGKWKNKPSEVATRRSSFIIVLAGIILVITLVFTLLIPELVKSVKTTGDMLEQRIPEWTAYLEDMGIEDSYIEDAIEKLDIAGLLKQKSGTIDTALSAAASKIGSIVGSIATAGFGLIIGIYLILSSKRTYRHTYKLVYGFLPTKWANQIYHVAGIFQKSFTNFLTGQCVEAVILGILMFLAFTIFRLPYASLVGVITAFCAIIPYVGAFLSCAVSIVLTLLIDPTLIIRTAIVYLCVQFVENQFIYPRVVGGSVGMPPLYTLIAAMIGGKLFGIIGILFFIPFMATLIEIVKEQANKRLAYRNLKFNHLQE